MKHINKIPISKIERASNIISTGAKVGKNYVKYVGNRITKSKDEANKQLDKENAKDIYDGLKTLKGSALKVAQMLSMDKSLLPEAYVEMFSLSQFSVPPLSPSLVQRTFRKAFGKNPEDIFDSFNYEAKHAASIGQVHEAIKEGKQLAVKIQYPGVAKSVDSDLALVKPFALKILKLKADEIDTYFNEVRNKLMEETDYALELEQGTEAAEQCSKLPNILFPVYYKHLSNDRILSMDWMEGKHIGEVVKNSKDYDLNKIGQTLWDFYMYQLHVLKNIHADPHPGNFLITDKSELVVIDFGCMKQIPMDFYVPYFEMVNKDARKDEAFFEKNLQLLDLIKPTDSPKDLAIIKETLEEMLRLATEPFQHEVFNFDNPAFLQEMAKVAEKNLQSKELRSLNMNRGSKHFIYMNRTFFGLYQLMFDLKATNIKVNNWKQFA